VDPSEELQTPKGAETLPETLTQAEVERLLETVSEGLEYPSAHSRALKLRDQTLVLLLYATGLRVSELVGLTTHSIDLDAGLVRVRGKGDKERVVPFPSSVRDLIERYLAEARPQFHPEDDSVFLHHRGGRLSRQAFWSILKRLADKAGLPGSPSPHTLRHSFATHLLQGGMNLRSLQILLGHSDLSTTQLYTHLVPDELRKAVQKFHPRGQGDANN
jgi:integrase/recombinase XerD